jgi:molecular chaperone HscB
LEQRQQQFDPFETLGVEPDFGLDARALRAAWLRHASASHPDASGSVGASARANEAYRMLQDPVGRALALLARRRAPQVDERALPPGFLMQLMELRERVDGAGSDEERRSVRAEATAGREEAIKRIASAFVQSGSGAMAAEHAQAVHTDINVLRSFDRVIEQLDREAGGS